MGEWDTLQVGDHINFLSGFPFSSEFFSQEDGIPLIRIRDLAISTIETKYSGPFDPKWIVRSGDVLIGMDGDFTIVKWRNADALLNQRILKVETKPKAKIDAPFFYYWCGPRLDTIHAKTAATTVKHLSVRDLIRIEAPFPKLAEQQRIAEILSTVDEAIEQTEALIAKTQQIKAGLMHDLFTRGVTPDGHLRPPLDEAPHLYQESPLGWIPKEWKAASLLEVAHLDVGFPFKSEWFEPDGIALLRGENVGFGKADWDDRRCLAVSRRDEFLSYLLSPGDVVIGMDRTFTKSGVKISVLSESDCPALLVQRVGKFRAHACRHVFLRWLVESPLFLRQLSVQQKGMDIPHLSKEEILAPSVPVPPETEQELIDLQMRVISDQLNAEKRHVRKLKELKAGLMHDLLTGHVRVPRATATPA